MESHDWPQVQARLRGRARLAYERGRLQLACGRCLPALGVVGGALWLTPLQARAVVAVTGVLLLALCLVMHVIGRGFQEGVGIGVLAGALTGGSARVVFEASGCCASSLPTCALACGTGGLLVGAWLATRLLLRPRGRSSAVASTVAAVAVSAMTAALVCLPIGVGVVLGALAGLALGLMPAIVLRPAT